MRLRAIFSFVMTLLVASVVAVPAFADSGGGVVAPSDGGSSPAQAPQPPPSGGPSGPTGPQGQAPDNGGSAFGGLPGVLPHLTVPGTVAKVVNGLAEAPAAAPLEVQNAIWTANQIIGLPYVFGGGHSAFQASGYDCSGTVSYALHGGSLLTSPLDSSQFERWGQAGRGQWISVYANAGHAYMNIAGIRLDTSSAGDRSHQQGPRWRPMRHSNRGYRIRHPAWL